MLKQGLSGLRGGVCLLTGEKEIELALTRALPCERVKLFEPMAKHTTLRVGGPARFFVQPTTMEQLKSALDIAREYELPVLIIGNGSNLLVKDGGYRGMVLSTLSLNRAVWNEDTVRVEAGLRLSTLAREAAIRSLSGLEFAAGIPGTVGGAVYMNAGAYGGEMSQVVERVWILDQAGTERELSFEECGFSYRTSNIAKEKMLLMAAQFQLTAGAAPQIQEEMNRLMGLRKAKQPLDFPSAGSFFKRPPGDYAGRLIQAAGLLGTAEGGAEVSTLHANFLVNRGGATAQDFLKLAQYVVETVERKFGTRLQMEVQVVGED